VGLARKRLLLAALLILEIGGLLILAEGITALLDLDTRLLGKLLYYQNADRDVHIVSEVPGLHYELKPGASAVYKNGRVVKINSLGFRDPPHSRVKPPGTTRIICLGSSNTYGALVQNEQTYPAMLEKLLNSRLKGKYEVWNGGVSAYVLPQNLAAAEKAVREYSPDLLIFQLQNCGRKPFLYSQPFAQFFARDPGLYAENLRFSPERLPGFLRRFRLSKAALYLVNAGSAWRDPARYSEDICLRTRDGHAREFAKFRDNNRGKVRLAFLLDPSGGANDPSHADLSGLGIPTIDLHQRLPPGCGPEYRDIHPPAHVYQWYAGEILSGLAAAGLLPGAEKRH